MISLKEAISGEAMQNDKKVLDLCQMTNEDTKRINELFDEYADKYTEFVDRLSAEHNGCEFWWATKFASRNVYLSNAYWDICVALYAIEKIQNDSAIKIIKIDKKEIAIVISDYVRRRDNLSHLSIKCISEKDQSENALVLLYSYFKTIFRRLGIKHKICKVSGNRSKLPDQEIVLIEENIIEASCENGNFSSRDFTNLLKYTDEEIYILPHIHAENREGHERVIQCLNNSREYRFLHREDFIGIFDCIKLLQYPFFCFKWGRRKYSFENLDVSAIIKADLMQGLTSVNSLNSLLGYYAINNMKKKNINIKALVGWYEGQPSSIGIFMAYRRKYPNGKSTGYIGIPTDEKYISRYPSKEQVSQRVVPEAISVISDIYKNLPCKYADNVRVKLCPSFRINISNRLKKDDEEQKIIFCTLPITKIESQKIICMLEAASQSLGSFLIIIKNHPYNREWKLEDYNIKKVSFNYEFSTDSFEKLVNRARIVITSSPSTTGAETLLYGRKAIVVAAPGRITASCIPNSISDSLYRVVYGEKELEQAISDLTIQDTLNDKVFDLVELNETSVRELFI